MGGKLEEMETWPASIYGCFSFWWYISVFTHDAHRC